jgi:hypothetical protein
MDGWLFPEESILVSEGFLCLLVPCRTVQRNAGQRSGNVASFRAKVTLTLLPQSHPQRSVDRTNGGFEAVEL